MESFRERVKVDPEDEWLLNEYPWHVNSNGYARGKLGSIQVNCYLHHAVMGTPIWEGDEIDHINRDKLDNRRGNLRYANKYEQQRNSTRVEQAACIYPHRNRFQVKIMHKRVLYRSSHATMEEAVAARDAFLASI